VLEVRNASKIYQGGTNEVVALADVTLSLAAGQVAGIVGPSGSGKTTFLLIAGLLEPPTKGEVRFFDKPVSDPRTKLNSLRDLRRSQIGFVFQKGQLIPFLNAVENVQIALEINDIAGKAARNRAHQLLNEFGLKDRTENYPKQLSGGEQQRVSIARALANNPAVILADEPTAALDGPRGHQVMTLFRGLADLHNVAVCVVTHDPRWSGFFDRIARLSDGRLVDIVEHNRTSEGAQTAGRSASAFAATHRS
jgi:putative ABC transport system ATP-binding protein